jgi:transcriptional regulator with XRE-family HTH domain
MKPNKIKDKKPWMDEDISFQSPVMTAAQREANLLAFGDYRLKTKGKISDNDKLRLRFLRLKFQINSFLNAQKSDYSFSFFLALYIKCLGLNGKTFADEISLQPSELSQILHNRRDPNEKIMMRLEIHSNYNFPAPLWYEVLAKQKALELMNDKKLREQEQANVQSKVDVVI